MNCQFLQFRKRKLQTTSKMAMCHSIERTGYQIEGHWQNNCTLLITKDQFITGIKAGKCRRIILSNKTRKFCFAPSSRHRSSSSLSEDSSLCSTNLSSLVWSKKRSLDGRLHNFWSRKMFCGNVLQCPICLWREHPKFL